MTLVCVVYCYGRETSEGDTGTAITNVLLEWDLAVKARRGGGEVN